MKHVPGKKLSDVEYKKAVKILKRKALSKYAVGKYDEQREVYREMMRLEEKKCHSQ